MTLMRRNACSALDALHTAHGCSCSYVKELSEEERSKIYEQQKAKLVRHRMNVHVWAELHVGVIVWRCCIQLICRRHPGV